MEEKAKDAIIPLVDDWFRYDLLQDPDCLQWFLWWMVQGGVLWEVEGLPDEHPKRIQIVNGAYKTKSNVFQDLILDCNWTIAEETTEDPVFATPSAIVYQSYRQHAIDGGNTPLAQRTFTQRLIIQYPVLTTGLIRINGVPTRVIFGIYRQH